MLGINGSSLKASIDWLTVTANEPMAAASLMMTLMAVVGIEFITHERKRPWNFMGYHGQAYEGLRYGIRDEGAIVMLSGSLAGRLWHLIAPQRSKCTRVDMTVTTTLDEVNGQVVETGYEQALATSRLVASKIVNSQGGTTLYLGSRTSKFFGRLYDKGAEEGGAPGICWRYEVECKKPASEVAVSRLLDSSDVPAFVVSFVHNWFERNGITPLFPPTNVECAIEIEARVTSDDKALEWLSSQVRPTVGRLIINGKEGELLEALGLPGYMKPLVNIT